MEDSRRTAVMFMHLSWRRKNKEKKGKGREAKRQGQEEVRGGVWFAEGSACSELGCSQKARQTGEGWRLIWNNPAFRRLYAWRLWAMGLVAGCRRRGYGGKCRLR